jgi:hypothetical protein
MLSAKNSSLGAVLGVGLICKKLTGPLPSAENPLYLLMEAL